MTEEEDDEAGGGGVGAPRDGVEPGVEKRERATHMPPPGDAPPHPPSYMDVMEMLKKVETPPGIRDIDDKPPDPDATIPAATMSRRRKPWEKSEGASGAANGGGDTAGGELGSSPPGDSPPARACVDSPAVADLKRKLDALAAALVAAIAAILIRKFVRSLGEGEP